MWWSWWICWGSIVNPIVLGLRLCCYCCCLGHPFYFIYGPLKLDFSLSLPFGFFGLSMENHEMEENNMPSGRLTSRTFVFISNKPLLRLKYIYMHTAQSHVHQKVCLSLLASMFCGERLIIFVLFLFLFFGCFWGSLGHAWEDRWCVILLEGWHRSRFISNAAPLCLIWIIWRKKQCLQCCWPVYYWG